MNHHMTGAMTRARHDDLDRAAAARLRQTTARERTPAADVAPVRSPRRRGVLGLLGRRAAAPVLAAGAVVPAALTAIGGLDPTDAVLPLSPTPASGSAD